MSTAGSFVKHKVPLYGLVVFYLLGGINHFINPDFYLPLIPDYLPFHEGINYLSGAIEIGLAIGVFLSMTRLWASRLIILMLLAFIPSHVYFIQVGSCVEDGLCVSEWIGWLRLLLIHPLLILWAYWVGRKRTSHVN